MARGFETAAALLRNNAASSTATHWMMSTCGAVKSLAAVRYPTRCRLRRFDSSTEGKHGRGYLKVAIRGQFLLQERPVDPGANGWDSAAI